MEDTALLPRDFDQSLESMRNWQGMEIEVPGTAGGGKDGHEDY